MIIALFIFFLIGFAAVIVLVGSMSAYIIRRVESVYDQIVAYQIGLNQLLNPVKVPLVHTDFAPDRPDSYHFDINENLN